MLLIFSYIFDQIDSPIFREATSPLVMGVSRAVYHRVSNMESGRRRYAIAVHAGMVEVIPS
jgi:hypothetical protein